VLVEILQASDLLAKLMKAAVKAEGVMGFEVLGSIRLQQAGDSPS
jgi:hypothetical protein